MRAGGRFVCAMKKFAGGGDHSTAGVRPDTASHTARNTALGQGEQSDRAEPEPAADDDAR